MSYQFPPNPFEDPARDIAAPEKQRPDNAALTACLREALDSGSVVVDAQRTVLNTLTTTENTLVGFKAGAWIGGVFGFFVGVFAAMLLVAFGGVKP